LACSTGVDRAAIGDGKEEAVVLWPGICSTIVSFRYHFILGVSRFLTVCETSPLPLPVPLFSSPTISLDFGSAAQCSAFYSPLSFSFPNIRFLSRPNLSRRTSLRELRCRGSILGAKLNFTRYDIFLRYIYIRKTCCK